MVIELTNEKKALVNFAAKTEAGNNAQVDGGVTANVIEGDVQASVERKEDGSFDLNVVSGEPGVSKIQLSADADLGDGVRTITDVVVVNVVAAEAVTFGFGTPEVSLK